MKVFQGFIAIVLATFSSALAAEQITTPNPADTTGFGVHRLPTTSPHPDRIAFSSYAGLVPEDTNGMSDVYFWSRSAGALRLLSIGTNANSNGSSYEPALSKDGRFVAFISSASNFVTDTNKIDDVFVVDQDTGVIEKISVSAKATGGRINGVRLPVISADGRYIAYTSIRLDLIATNTSLRGEHVFVRDRQAGATLWANQTIEPTLSPAPARPIAIHGSLLWLMQSTNLYSFDLSTQTLTLRGPVQTEPVFSSDGSVLAIQSTTTRTNVVRRYLVATGTDEILVTSTNGTLRYDALSMSANGRVAFISDQQLAAGDADSWADVYVTKPSGETGDLELISAIEAPAGSTNIASSPVITDDGSRVYFRLTTITGSLRETAIYVKVIGGGAPEVVIPSSTTAPTISRLIKAQGGLLVLAESNLLGFPTSSTVNDLAFIVSPLPPPELKLELSRSANNGRIVFPKWPDKTPRIQYSETLEPGSWNDVQGAVEETDTHVTVTDSTTANMRFYRAVVDP